MIQGIGSLVPLASGFEPARAAIVRELPGTKGAKPEEVYRAWLELIEQRIAGEQLLSAGYAVQIVEKQTPGDGGLFAVLSFFDLLAPQLFTRKIDVGELSNYIAADARHWRDLLRDLRRRSSGAKETPCYHQVTRALATAEFLASEPIADAERTKLGIVDIETAIDTSGRAIEISGQIINRNVSSQTLPNISICLRDENSDVCGEVVLAPPATELAGQASIRLLATLEASSDIVHVEISLTRGAPT